jgi:hypothetical protein
MGKVLEPRPAIVIPDKLTFSTTERKATKQKLVRTPTNEREWQLI